MPANHLGETPLLDLYNKWKSKQKPRNSLLDGEVLPVHPMQILQQEAGTPTLSHATRKI